MLTNFVYKVIRSFYTYINITIFLNYYLQAQLYDNYD